MKGAAAASLYGARAANGVIQIRTARGRNLIEGETRITFRGEVGQNYLGKTLPQSTHHPYLVDETQTCMVPISVVPGEW